MLQSLVITLREGIEAALIVGLTLSYLEKTGRRDLKPAVWHALGLAILGSVIGALLLQSVVSVSEELVEGTLMLVAAVFVGTTMLWMHRAGKRLAGDIRQKVDAAGERRGGGAWALGLFVFFMVMREGAETVLFLSAISLSSSGASSLLGAALGLALAAAFALAFFKGAIQLDFRRFFLATTFILGVLVVELLLHSYHEFAEIGWLPANQSTMAIVGPAVKNSVLFVFALLALPMVLYLAPSSERAKDADVSTGASGPEARKLRADAFRRKAWGVAFLATGSTIIGLLFFDYLESKKMSEPGKATILAVEGNVVRVPLEGLEADKQHLFVVDIGDHPVRFFVFVAGHEPKVCLDACEICGSTGYVQDGRQLICINCGAEIYPPSLGQSGGCNPIPLPFTLVDGAVVISRSALEAGADMF